jgi:hypothetical protein
VRYVPPPICWSISRSSNGMSRLARPSAHGAPHVGSIHQRDGILGLESHLESRPKAAERLDLEVSEGWASPSSRGLCGGDALLLSTDTGKTTGTLALFHQMHSTHVRL